jgi:hypothetical protein
MVLRVHLTAADLLMLLVLRLLLVNVVFESLLNIKAVLIILDILLMILP